MARSQAASSLNALASSLSSQFSDRLGFRHLLAESTWRAFPSSYSASVSIFYIRPALSLGIAWLRRGYFNKRSSTLLALTTYCLGSVLVSHRFILSCPCFPDWEPQAFYTKP